ncbi:MAG: sodium/proton-translocating pyrophosphatase [Desulfobacterales bacterium]|nr:sodium/proton-translocating pyrophosphatase [Desulfobacterales bacterium]
MIIGAVGGGLYLGARSFAYHAIAKGKYGVIYGLSKGIGYGIIAGFGISTILGLNGVVTVCVATGIVASAGMFIAKIGIADMMLYYCIARGVGFGILFGIIENYVIGVTLIITLGLYYGMKSPFLGLILTLSGAISFAISYFRIVHYTFEIPIHLLTIFCNRLQPQYILHNIKYSPAFWDEKIYFPLPYLDNLLRQGFKQNKQEGLKRIEYVAQSFRKEHYAFSALAWITADTLAQTNSTTSLIQNIKSVNWLPENLQNLGKDTAEIFPNLQAISTGLESSLKSDLYSKRLSLRNAIEQLDTLNNRVKFLGRLATERWQPVIEQWHKVISEELLNLSTSDNHAQVSENPYQTGNPLQRIRQTLFKGRTDLINIIAKTLLEKHRPTIVLHCPRRMGKTSFLLQLPALLPGNTIPIFADLQRPAFVQDTASFLYSLARAISSDARPYRIIIPSPERQFFEKSPFSAFEDWLDKEALPKLQNFNILLTFDEFENLGKAIEKEKISTDLLDELRHLIQHQTQMAFLFAGVKTMEDLGQNWSSYFINIKPVPMSYLLPDEVHELIVNPDKNANFTLKYHEEVITRITEMTKCHPYLVQLVCSAVVEEANLAKNNFADSEILEKAVNRALQQGEPYFRNVWDEMAGTDGQEILRQIALSETPLNFPDTDTKIQKALAQMVKLKVLTKTDEKYSVEVPLVKQWITELAPVK